MAVCRLPFGRRVEFHGDDLNAVPCSNTDPTEEALPGDDGRLTEGQEQEEGAAS